MKKATAITCVFLDIGGVLLTNGSDHHARKRATTNWDDEPFGYVALRGAHVHVAAYDANGKLLAEKIDKINGNYLVRWHFRPRPVLPLRCSFPGDPFKSPRSL